MALELKALVIDSSMSALEQLESKLQPEFEFEYIDIVNNVHKAIQYHIDMDFQLCLIGDKFPPAELNSFFTDYGKLQKENSCIFIQFRERLDLQFDRTLLTKTGFQTIISLQCDADDKAELLKALRPMLLKKEYEEVLTGLPDIVDNLMKEIDKIALEKKRGKDKSLSRIYSEHLKDSADKFTNLHQDYIEKLIKTADGAPPFERTKLKVPDKVIGRKLPNLQPTRYTGQSHRVFDRLRRLHGEKSASSETSPLARSEKESNDSDDKE